MTRMDIRRETRCCVKWRRRILASVRNYDYVGRYGGEEFLIVLGDCYRL